MVFSGCSPRRCRLHCALSIKGPLIPAGNINDVLYGASLIPNLVSLDLSYNAFTGTLPVSLTMPNLQVLNLHYNYIRV